eukprot:PhF_6_TR16379/c0_g1_i1/m.25197/K07962/ARL13B, ARL2L1; ADP-ribosylation factor-like protein 13B
MSYDNTSNVWKTNASLKITLLMLGLGGSGKTALVHAMQGEPKADTMPTMGFTPFDMGGGEYELCVYDVGGHAKFRGIWNNYYGDVFGVIFVVDASDPDLFPDVKASLAGVLAD